jgi:hypothetical protein
MGAILTVIAGLVIWVVLWAIGVSGFDGFLVTIVFLILAAAAHILRPFLPGARSREQP